MKNIHEQLLSFIKFQLTKKLYMKLIINYIFNQNDRNLINDFDSALIFDYYLFVILRISIH